MKKRSIILLNVLVALTSVLLTYCTTNPNVILHHVTVTPENNGLGSWHLYTKLGELPIESIDWGTMQPESTKELVLYLQFIGGRAVTIKNLTISWSWYIKGPLTLSIWFSDTGVEFKKDVLYHWRSDEVWCLHFQLTIVSDTVFNGSTEVNFAQIFNVQPA